MGESQEWLEPGVRLLRNKKAGEAMAEEHADVLVIGSGAVELSVSNYVAG